MRRKRTRILKRLVLGFAVGVLVVPSAAVAARGGTVQQGSSVKAGAYGTVRPMPSDSAKAAVAGNISIENVRLNPRGSSNTITGDIEQVRLNPRTVSTPEVVSAGFDWGDAGIGAGVILGLVLVGGAAFYGTRRHRGQPQTA